MNVHFQRRGFLKLAGATAALSVAGCATTTPKARVVVVGGGFGGATAAKYIRMWDPAIEVVMVERADVFTSCPISNLVLGGSRSMRDIRHGYAGLRRHGVQRVTDEVTAVDTARRVVKLARGGDLSYDRLIVSPGIDFMFNELPGYESAMNAGRVLHAWKPGEQRRAAQETARAVARRRRVHPVEMGVEGGGTAGRAPGPDPPFPPSPAARGPESTTLMVTAVTPGTAFTALRASRTRLPGSSRVNTNVNVTTP